MKTLQLFFISLTLLFITSCTDPCSDVDCGTNGTCDDGTCLCETGYEGTNCETAMNEKFLGVWNANDWLCDGEATDDSQFQITVGTAANEVLLFDPTFPIIQFKGTVSGTELTIPTQDVSFLGEVFVVSGNGDITNGVFTLTITDETENSVCSGILSK